MSEFDKNDPNNEPKIIPARQRPTVIDVKPLTADTPPWKPAVHEKATFVDGVRAKLQLTKATAEAATMKKIAEAASSFAETTKYLADAIEHRNRAIVHTERTKTEVRMEEAKREDIDGEQFRKRQLVPYEVSFGVTQIEAQIEGVTHARDLAHLDFQVAAAERYQKIASFAPENPAVRKAQKDAAVRAATHARTEQEADTVLRLEAETVVDHAADKHVFTDQHHTTVSTAAVVYWGHRARGKSHDDARTLAIDHVYKRLKHQPITYPEAVQAQKRWESMEASFTAEARRKQEEERQRRMAAEAREREDREFEKFRYEMDATVKMKQYEKDAQELQAEAARLDYKNFGSNDDYNPEA